MQDRYAGDVGDYGKIGLLKRLQKHGFAIGINWYLVPTLDVEKNADGTLKQDDGRYLIPDDIKKCDPKLAETLTDIACSDNRSVSAIQNADLIPNAVYYDERLAVDTRDEWHRKALERFKDSDLVFLDPDNGLLVKSVGKRSARSVKYAFYEEVKDYIDAGKSVLIYNHRSRKPEAEYFGDIEDNLQERVKVYKDVIQAITFSKGTTRDYIAIPACKEHYWMFCNALDAMKKGKWGRLGACRLYPDHPGDFHYDYLTYEESIFVDYESEVFNEDCTFEEYKKDVVRYLTLCDFQYPEKIARSLVKEENDYLKGRFGNKASISDVAIEIGLWRRRSGSTDE